MKGVCGIEIDNDKIFVSLGALKKHKLWFIEDTEINSLYKKDNFLEFLKENLGTIDGEIRGREKKYSIKVEKVFLNLPWGIEKHKIVEDIIPLRKRKKITYQDIYCVKKQLEEIFLEWDDFCIHHIVLSYGIEGKEFTNPPIGEESNKIRLKSFLIWIKDKLHKEITSIFDSYERQFAGFVSPIISNLSLCLHSKEDERNILIINIGYEKSYVISFQNNKFTFLDFDFSLKKIICKIQNEFMISFDLAREIFFRHFSFKKMAPFKEINVKERDSYINISLNSLNSLTKKYVIEEINKILIEVDKDSLLKSPVFFTGRLATKDGFYDIFKNTSSFFINPPVVNKNTLSYGCLRYGIFPFLEKNYTRKSSFFQKILNIYKEYF
jgi:cell division ATPase FtsA